MDRKPILFCQLYPRLSIILVFIAVVNTCIMVWYVNNNPFSVAILIIGLCVDIGVLIPLLVLPSIPRQHYQDYSNYDANKTVSNDITHCEGQKYWGVRIFRWHICAYRTSNDSENNTNTNQYKPNQNKRTFAHTTIPPKDDKP